MIDVTFVRLKDITMTQEDNSLLLQDLCARLPYGVHCCVLNLNKTIKEDNDIIYGIVGDNIVSLKSNKDECYMYYQIKPYLRLMSSMTEEERKEYENCYQSDDTTTAILLVDFYNKKHFDHRGLIPMGLALEAPADMYNIKVVEL